MKKSKKEEKKETEREIMKKNRFEIAISLKSPKQDKEREGKE